METPTKKESQIYINLDSPPFAPKKSKINNKTQNIYSAPDGYYINHLRYKRGLNPIKKLIF